MADHGRSAVKNRWQGDLNSDILLYQMLMSARFINGMPLGLLQGSVSVTVVAPRIGNEA